MKNDPAMIYGRFTTLSLGESSVMKSVIRTCVITILAFGLAGCANKPSDQNAEMTLLSEYETEVIVAEYHQRLTKIIDTELPAAQKKFQYQRPKPRITDTNPRAIHFEPLSNDDRATFESTLQELNAIADRLRTFASSGNISAQAALGPIQMFGALGNEHICDGVDLTLMAAQRGSPVAANILATAYLGGFFLFPANGVRMRFEISTSMTTQFFLKGSLWLLEASHRGEVTEDKKNEFLSIRSEAERAKLIEQWSNWTPRSENADDLKSAICQTD
ncbi:MAG: hypothetical protein RIB43_16715 [Rhodospirillaceae bacterium]